MPTPPAPILLLTRPQPLSQQLAARLGMPAIIAPVMRIVPVDHDAGALARARGLVFTSVHAVGAAGPGRGRPAICVGDRTAAAARAAGFAVTVGTGGAAGLLPLIAASAVPLIHPHGRHLAHSLPVPGMVVYDQQAIPLTDAARGVLRGDAPVICPLYSPRSAKLLSDQVMDLGAHRAPIWVVSISPGTDAAWRAGAARRGVADAPWGAAMDEAIRRIAAEEPS